MFVPIEGFAAVQGDAGVGGFELPAEGEHTFTIAETSYEKSKAGTSNNLVLQLLIDDAADSNNGWKGKAWRNISGKAYPQKRLRQLLTACGIKAENGFDTDALVGRQFVGTVRHTEKETVDEEGAVSYRKNYEIINERAVGMTATHAATSTSTAKNGGATRTATRL